jgi:hypothetical protein
MTNESLKGWKEIAGFLQTSVRNAHRWEQDFGMPVRRVTGRRGDLVFADPEELLRWQCGRVDADRAPEDRAEPVAASTAETGAGVVGGRIAGGLSRGRRWRLAAVAMVALSVASLFVWTRWSQPDATAATVKRAATKPAVPPVAAEPLSNAVSLMRVVIGGEDAQPLLVGIFDGGMASIGAEHGPSFGLLGRRHGDEFTVFVVLLDAARSQKGGTARQVGTLHLRRNQPVSWAHEGLQMRVEWIGIRVPSVAAPESSPSRTKECTITCNRVVVTAATVETSCGKCCDPTACSPTR